MNTTNATYGESQKISRVITAALAAGLRVSVSDGEGGFNLKRSTELRDILNAVGEMDMDELIFRNAANERVGWMMLVWGNAGDGSELVSDYTANATMEALANA